MPTNPLDHPLPVQLLAFVDILGFGQRVRQIDTIDKFNDVLRLHDRILAPMHYLAKYPGDHNEPLSADLALTGDPDYDADIGERLGFQLGIPVKLRSPAHVLAGFVISDAIVIHGPPNDDNKSSLCALLLKLARDLMLEGILLRGAIVVDRFTRRNTLSIGAALVDAYEQESTIAIYPRILVPSEFQSIGLPEFSDDPPIKEDEDGRFYLDVFFRDLLSRSSGRHMDLFPSYRPFHQNVRAVISRLLVAHADDQRVFPKIDWLTKKFNVAVAKHPDLGVACIEQNG